MIGVGLVGGEKLVASGLVAGCSRTCDQVSRQRKMDHVLFKKASGS